MPVCHRCHRCQATAELRRTTLGFLCKENGPGTACSIVSKRLRDDNRAAMRATRRAEKSAA